MYAFSLTRILNMWHPTRKTPLCCSPGKANLVIRGLSSSYPSSNVSFPLTTFQLYSDWKLAAIGIYKPPDVRAILEAYEGKNIPIEYAKKEAESKRQFIEEWKARGGGKVRSSAVFRGACIRLTRYQGLSSGGFTVSSLFSGNEKVSTLTPFPPLLPKLSYSPSPEP